MHLLRLDPEQQGIQAGHHQALDVVRIAMAQGLREGIAQAGHVGFAGPVKTGQGSLRGQRIVVGVFRHLGPVDAAHEFAPAQDLPNKALDRRQGRIPCPVSVLSRLHDLPGAQQLEVHR